MALLRELQVSSEKDYDKYWIWTKIAFSFSPTTQFNILTKVGICITSALSGFGVVNMPFMFFQYYDPTISNIKKSNIEDDIKAVMDDIK